MQTGSFACNLTSSLFFEGKSPRISGPRETDRPVKEECGLKRHHGLLWCTTSPLRKTFKNLWNSFAVKAELQTRGTWRYFSLKKLLSFRVSSHLLHVASQRRSVCQNEKPNRSIGGRLFSCCVLKALLGALDKLGGSEIKNWGRVISSWVNKNENVTLNLPYWSLVKF